MNILNVISAVSPMGGTITKLRVIMTNTKHTHVLYQPGFKYNEDEIIRELGWYKEHGIPAYYGIYGRNILKNALEVSKIIKKHKIDIVHLYFNHEQSFAFLIKLLNPKVILVRSIVGIEKRLPWYRRLVVRLSLSSVSNYVFISNYIKTLYEQDYPVLKKKNTRIIYNGPVNVRPPHNNIEDRKNLVVVGGLCERKNSMVLVEAMNIIVNEYMKKEIKLYIIGDGEQRELCEKKLVEYNIEKNVVLVGYTNEVSRYLDDCAIYVHPATTEGFGIAVVEAMYMGCPCVVADKGALPELIENGESGFVVGYNNPNEWARKISYLLDNNEKRTKMGKNAAIRARKCFSIENFIENHNVLYDSMDIKHEFCL